MHPQSTRSLCSVEGCARPVCALGFCTKHYQRVKKHGTPDGRTVPPFAERLLSRVDQSGGPNACWPWLGSMHLNGYAQVTTPEHASYLGHRAMYELLIGPIPEGLDLDHLCRNRACVNPTHLEPVTRQVNLLRGIGIPAQQVKKTHCPAGHPYDAENTAMDAGHRLCRTCGRERARVKRGTLPENIRGPYRRKL